MSRVPPHLSGSHQGLPRDKELEHLEELGDDAIIAQQQGAHAPVPRAQVTEDARSIVISEHPAADASPATGGDRNVPEKKRSSRTEKTVVIRDRRQIEELRRQMAQHKPARADAAPSSGVLLWVIVGALAFLTGGLAALLATRDDDSASSAIKPVVSQAPQPSPPPVTAATAEPPKVSIDELPIEGGRKR